MKPSAALWAVFSLQVVCAAFFTFDAVLDITGWGQGPNWTESDMFEYLVTIALGGSLVFTAGQIRTMLRRQKRIEDQLKVASGAFADLLNEHFESWSLSPSERDVALMAIKGLSIAEIARVRETKDGTIKAQCNAIYRKAGVSGRQQLLSLFIEELVADNGTPEAA